MIEAKNTQRAIVRIGYDGRVHKFFQGPNAQERFDNECRVLIHLENRKCGFVPRLLSSDRNTLEMVTSNCGARVERLSDDKIKSIFAELEEYGVRHDDAFLRNITYRASDGRFCVIDFEFSTILDEVSGATSSPTELASQSSQHNNQPIAVRWSAMTHSGSFRSNNEDRFLAMLIDQRGVRYLGSILRERRPPAARPDRGNSPEPPEKTIIRCLRFDHLETPRFAWTFLTSSSWRASRSPRPC